MARTESRNAFEANQSCDVLGLTECEKRLGVGGERVGVNGDREGYLQRSCVHLESMTVKFPSCSDPMDVGP